MTWFIVITVFGATVWNLGPMTEAECAQNKPVVVAYVDRLAADGASMVLHGRVVTRSDVEIECKPEGEIGR